MWGHEHHEQVEVTNIGILTNIVGNYKYIWVCERYLKWLWTWNDMDMAPPVELA